MQATLFAACTQSVRVASRIFEDYVTDLQHDVVCEVLKRYKELSKRWGVVRGDDC